VKCNHIQVSSALFEAKRLAKINLNPSTPKEGEKNIVKLESLYNLIVVEKKVWIEGKPSWQEILKELEGASSSS
jgi:disulfide oxidoreductase YuzD